MDRGWGGITGRADPRPTSHPVTNLISHNGIILYQWEFLRARLDEGEGLPWIAMDMTYDMQYIYMHTQ